MGQNCQNISDSRQSRVPELCSDFTRTFSHYYSRSRCMAVSQGDKGLID